MLGHRLKCEDAGVVNDVAALNSTTVLVPRIHGANTAANAASTSLNAPITPNNTAPTNAEDVTANNAAPLPVSDALSVNASMVPVLPPNVSAETETVAVPTAVLSGKGEHDMTHTVLNRFGIAWEGEVKQAVVWHNSVMCCIHCSEQSYHSAGD